jgi:WD40 repeat protein
VATASDEERPGGRTDLSAYVWDAGSGASHCSGACVFGDPALELTDITFSADSRYLVTSALNGHIVWRAADGAAVLRSLDGGHEYDPRLERGMVAIEAGPVDISGRGVVGIVNVGFDADGVLITVDAESAHRRWSSPLWELVPDSEAAAANGDWRPTAPPADGFLRSPTGMLTVRLGEPTSAGEVLDPRTGNILTTVRPGSEPVLAAAFSADGTWLALADGTRSVRLHRWETLAPLDRLQERAAQLVDPLDPAERARLVPSVWQRLNAWLGVVTRRRVARASGRSSMRPAREASFPPVPSRAGPRPRARA